MNVKEAGVKQQPTHSLRASNDGPRDLTSVPTLESVALWLRGVARTSKFVEPRAGRDMQRCLLNARSALSLKRPGRNVL